MAAHSPNFIRLRLFFDYPPPAVVGSRLCWLLVDLNSCRVVADLESIIRDKFDFSRGSILSLFVEDCYLPHTESIFVVRDNDTIRVKVDCLSQVNGHSIFPAETCRKRQRDSGEDGSGDERVSAQCKKKKKNKKKKRRNESSADGSHLVTTVNKSETPQGKGRTKKKKKKMVAVSHASTPPAAAPPHKTSLGVNKATKSSTNTPTAQNGPLSDSASVRKEKKASGSKSTSRLSSTPTASQPKPKPPQTPARTPSSSSSDGDSSSDKAVEVPPEPSRLTPTTQSTNSSHKPADRPATQSTNSSHKPADRPATQSTNSSHKPADRPVQTPPDTRAEPHHLTNVHLVVGHPQQPTQSVAGLWGGKSSRQDGLLAATGPGDRWKAKDKEQGERSFESSCRDVKETSYQTDSLSNVSIVLQNGAESVAQKDYSTMPLLAAPPQVGQTIAFKLLELTENYTPEISEYKEGKIVSFDPTTKHLELELLNASQAPEEPGKFDLVYQNPDGSETVEYALPRGSWVTERWESLLEPRLII